MPATVSGTYQLPDGSPSSGQVKFRLMPAIIDLTGTQITAELVQVPLDATGFFTVDLMAEGELEAGLVANGPIAYKVIESIDGLHRMWDLYVPDTTAINLPERYPGDVLSGTSAVLPVPGPPGPPGEGGGLSFVSAPLTSPPTSGTSLWRIT